MNSKIAIAVLAEVDLLPSATGGTSAFENAGGYAIQIGDTGQVAFTLSWVP